MSTVIDEKTGEEIVTRDGRDRRFRLCLCAECEEVERCTPGNDFWVAKGKLGLLCDRCFESWLNKGVLKPPRGTGRKGRR